MRPDMQEVLITPGRRGSGFSRNEELRKIRRKRIEDDETGWKQSCTPRGHHNWGDRKIDQKNDYLAPLKRYLESKVGQKWDDIYSEIIANNSPDSAVGTHIYNHLWGFVEQNPTYIDGKVCGPYQYTWGNTPSPLRKGDLYVDLDGRLARAPGETKVEKPTRIVLVPLGGNQYAVCNKKGVWFLLKYSNRMKKEKRLRQKFTGKYEEVDGAKRAIYINEEYEETFTYFREVHLKRDDFEILPPAHPSIYGQYDAYHTRRWNRFDKDKQYWYLIEYKTLSRKEKQKLGLA